MGKMIIKPEPPHPLLAVRLPLVFIQAPPPAPTPPVCDDVLAPLQLALYPAPPQNGPACV